MVGERIKAERERLGLSQNALAKRAHVAQGYVSMIERGERSRLSGDVIRKLARALNIPVTELMEDEPDLDLTEPPITKLKAVGWTDIDLQKLVSRWELLSPTVRLELLTTADDLYEGQQEVDRRVQQMEERVQERKTHIDKLLNSDAKEPESAA